jgi:cytoskeletal protein RodZ
MSVPNRQFDESLVRIQAQRLQDARLALGLTLHDFIQPLSTSRAQLDAVERANLDAFYAPFYYERLFRRYAEALSFASESIDDMVAAFTPADSIMEDEDPAAGGADAEDRGADAAGSVSPAEPAPLSAQPSVVSDPASRASVSEDSPSARVAALASQERDPGRILASAPSSRLAPGKRNSGLGWIGLVALLSVALLAAWLFTDQGDDRKVVSSGSKPAASTAGSEHGAPAPAEANADSAAPAASPTAESTAAPASAPATAATPATPATPNGSAAAAKPAVTPTQTPAAIAAPPTPAPPAPSSAAPAPSSATAATNVASGVPAMEIVPTGRSWIWVRQADDSIREFAVAAGDRVVFEQMPIYIVLARPEQAEVKISGRPVRLGRNDAERDLGRFGRSQLIDARSQGSTPSVPLAPQPTAASPSIPASTTPNP